MKNNLLSLLFMLLPGMLTISLSGCQDEDNEPNPLTDEQKNNISINEWILENMDYWYLWQEELKTDTDQKKNPPEFFDGILYEDDRFSWIQDNYQELLNSLKGVNKEGGYEFVLYRDKENENNVIAQVVYIKPGSPAEAAGLVRGDIISHINGTRLTANNYQAEVARLKQNHSLTYKSVDAESETFSSEKMATLSVVEYRENPNYMSKVIEVSGHKIGYYVYNLFAPGPNSTSEVYDNEMDAIFGNFKSSGITDLVVDLRFNSGGSETSSNHLASLIGTGVNSSKIFARKQYNEEVQKAIMAEPSLGDKFLNTTFTNKSSNVGSQLGGNRVYVLTSHRSASASELVINALKPYMEVFIIGDTTYGKNVGSISLYEENDRKNKWGMQPIVVKVANSLGESDYGDGFAPNILNKDNRLFLYPLGDVRENLLSLAIGEITGTPTTGRAATAGPAREIIGHSLDTKRSSYQLVVEDFRKY